MLQSAYQISGGRRVTRAAILCVVGALSGCTGSSSSGNGSSSSGNGSSALSARTYSLGATVSGLNSSGLVLVVNAPRQRRGEDLFITADQRHLPGPALRANATAVNTAAGTTTQELATSLSSGSSYSVTIETQPAGETCSVAGGTGTIQSANVANVVVTCSDQVYSLGGPISGLDGSGLVLANGTDTLAANSGASNFTMPTTVAYTSAYAVVVQTQPTGLTCSVSNGRGTMGSAAVNNIAVACSANTYTVGGSISGLTATGLVLLDNGGDALRPNANATQFTLNTGVAYGSAYAITVQSAPTGLVCGVSSGAGVVGAGDVTNVSVGCVPNFTLLYSFVGGSNDGATPYHSLIQASDGDFYGSTLTGGSSNGGTIYQITPSGTETIVHSFAGSPYAGVLQGSDGNFYGTTANGGTSGRGTVFELTPIGSETVLYSFPAGSSDPYCGLIQGSDGNFYGTTGAGGTNDAGTVFKITPSGTETVLHAFPTVGGSDGQTPYAGVIQGSDGNFYGTTYFGGSSGFGTVFKVTPGGVETVLYSFAGGSGDGANPYAGVVQGSDGNFYGTTYQGGASGNGTVFKITPNGIETVVYSFAGGSSDGANPVAGVIQGSDGNFYGVTYSGGANALGTVFKMTPSGTETILHAFAGGSSDGANPQANLVQGVDGNLYGSTVAGGSSADGTFFKVALQ